VEAEGTEQFLDQLHEQLPSPRTKGLDLRSVSIEASDGNHLT